MYAAHAEYAAHANVRMYYTVSCSARPQAFKGAINLPYALNLVLNFA